MCGIAGMVGEVDEESLRLMTQTLYHRGPDDGAVWMSSSGDAAFGHRRLKVIDPSPAARQPMRSADGRYALVFNGEIFNFRELQTELERGGARFRTRSDAEVLLEGFAVHGERILERLAGQFAFAVWDVEKRTLFAARDHLGIKPFYYASTGASFIFASEAKALLAAKPRLRNLRLDMLPLYLAFLWTPGADTLFEGIYRLEPGCWLRLHGGRIERGEYWHPADCTRPELPTDATERARAFRQLFEESVRSQLVSDVPLGLLLSGGIDSTAILAAMRAAGSDVQAFTATYADSGRAQDIFKDDLPFARKAAAFFGASLTERRIDADVPALLNRAIWHLDEPLGDPTVITNLALTKAAKSSLTVLLSGMGADEILAGYPRYPAALYGRRLSGVGSPVFSSLRNGIRRLRRAGALSLRRTRRAEILLSNVYRPFPENFFGLSTYIGHEEQLQLLNPASGVAPPEDLYACHRSLLERSAKAPVLDRMLITDLRAFLPCLNLENMDKTSMANAVEMRVPFLDHRLVEFALALPPGDKLRRLTRKSILRRAYKDSFPPEILARKKTGYSPPVRGWMRDTQRDFLCDTLFSSTSSLDGILEKKELSRLLSENDKGEADNSMKLWLLLSLELWHRAFIGSWNPPPIPDPSALPSVP